MPEFFIWSESGEAAFLGRRLKKEGHKVRMWVKDPHAKDVYRGIIPLSPIADPKKGEIIVFDTVTFGAMADMYKRRGYKVIGGATFADTIEIHRPVGTKLMRDMGIKVPETHVFANLSKGQEFLKENAGHWYYKPSGNMSCDLTFDGESGDLIRFLEYAKREAPEQFDLQKRMEGTEISLEGWFDGSKWVWPFNSTIEDKKFMSGGIGPRTGCMANLVWAYEDPRPILAYKTLTRIAPYLEKAKYAGPIDLNMILDPEGVPYGLEWSARFGYDALQAFCLLTQGDLGHQLARFVDGRLDGFETRTDAYALTINTSVPPYPNYAYAKEARGLPLDDAVLSNDHIYPRDVMLDKGGKPVVSGADACVMVIGAVGTDLSLLRKEVLNLAKNLHIPNLQYRNDPVERTESVLAALAGFGYDKPAIRIVAEPTRPIVPPIDVEKIIEGRVKAAVGPTNKSNAGVTKMAPQVDNPLDIPTFNE